MARGRVYKRGSTWSWRVDDPRASLQGARKQVSKGGYTTKRLAESALAEALVEMRASTHVDPSSMTLRDYLDEWLGNVRSDLRPSSFASYAVAIRRVNPSLGGLKLQAVQPVHLERLYRELLGKGFSPKTVRNTHVVVGRALADAERLGLVARNVARAVRAPRVERREHTVWDPGQIAEFLSQIESTPLYAPAAIAALTGMRRAEVVGLRWADVDFSRRTIKIVQSLTAVSGELIVGSPKTDHSRRSITIGPALAAILEARRAEQEAHRLVAGDLWVESDFVVTDELGNVVHPDRLTRGFSAAVAASGLPKIRFHDLRHSWATTALVCGIPAKTVSSQLGHAGISITLDVYTAVPDLSARAAAEGLEAQIFERKAGG